MLGEIRRAVIGDEDVRAALNPIVQDLHLTQRPDNVKPSDTREVAEWFRSKLDEPANMIRIVEAHGSPVGCLLALFHERPENPFCRARRWLEIDQVAIEEAERWKGLARALVERALEDAGAAGIPDVEISAWSFSEQARASFQPLGFRPRTIQFQMQLPVSST